MPSDDSLHQPHDKLFKRGFGQPETAAALFRAYLPERLTRHLDLSRAELVPGSFIDEHFRSLESDLLYRIPLGRTEILVYVLLEHQNQADRRTARRLYSYMGRIWEHFERAHPEARGLPPIVPIVLLQQPEGWRQETNFGALFDLSDEQRADFADVIPDFRFALIELAGLSYEQIVGTPMGVMTLRALKAQPLKALLSAALWDEALLAQLSAEDQRMVLRYILALGEVDRGSFAHRVDQLRGPKLRRDAMTLAEQFIEQGREEGREQGREQGVLIGRIQSLQSNLGRVESPAEELAGRSLDDLRALLEELRRKSH